MEVQMSKTNVPADPITAARQRKAEILSTALQQCGVEAADAALIDQAMRDQLAKACGLASGPSETTWCLVLGLLIQAEASYEQTHLTHIAGFMARI